MANPFSTIYTSSSAIRNLQLDIMTASHDLANVENPNHARQITHMAPNPAIPISIGGEPQSLGTGVSITSIERVVDPFVEAHLRDNISKEQSLSAFDKELQDVQVIMNDLGETGIPSLIEGFFNAWSAFAANPSQSALRLQVRQSGQNLASTLQARYKDLQTKKGELNQKILRTIQEVNNLAQQLHEINQQIRTTQGEGAHDLLNQQEGLLRKLCAFGNVTITAQSNGTASVYFGQFNLVDSEQAYNIPSTYDPATLSITDGTKSYVMKTGGLNGLFQAMNTLHDMSTQLDTLANTLRTQVNTLHRTGINKLGNTGVDFFNDSTPQTGAQDFAISSEVATNADAIASGLTSSGSDGGLAQSIAGLRNQSISALSGKTLSHYYREIAVDLGQKIKNNSGMLATQQAVVRQSERQRQSISGVSVEEVMMRLMQSQKLLQANAKLLRVADSILSDVIDILHR
jgi:flagellar hook-associated protein 1 FlgK